jgi:hypothetical protein
MKKIFTAVNTERFFSIVAVFLGVAKVFGLLSGISFFTTLGNTFAVAPSPNPYGHVRTAAPTDTDVGVSIGCQDADGQKNWRLFDHVVRSELKGPHRRGVTFLTYFLLYGRANRTPEEDSRVQKLTHYYFCGGPFSEVLHCTNPKFGFVRFGNSESDNFTETSTPCSL